MELLNNPNTYNHEPFHYTPAYNLADVICEGSDEEETLELITQKHLRYETEAQRIADGKLPVLQSTVIKGPLSPSWVNPWRHNPIKSQEDKRRRKTGKISYNHDNLVKKVSRRGLWYLAQDDTVIEYKASASEEAIRIGMTHGEHVIPVEENTSRTDKKATNEKEPLEALLEHSYEGAHDLVLRRDSYIVYTHGDAPPYTAARGLKRRREAQNPKISYNSKRARWNEEVYTSPTPQPYPKRGRRSKHVSLQAQECCQVASTQSFVSISLPQAMRCKKKEKLFRTPHPSEPNLPLVSLSTQENLSPKRQKNSYISKRKRRKLDELNLANSLSPSVSSLTSPATVTLQQNKHKVENINQPLLDITSANKTNLDRSCYEDDLNLHDEQDQSFPSILLSRNSTTPLEVMASEHIKNHNYTTDYDSSSRDLENKLSTKKRKNRMSNLDVEFSNPRKKRKSALETHNSAAKTIDCKNYSFDERVRQTVLSLDEPENLPSNLTAEFYLASGVLVNKTPPVSVSVTQWEGNKSSCLMKRKTPQVETLTPESSSLKPPSRRVSKNPRYQPLSDTILPNDAFSQSHSTQNSSLNDCSLQKLSSEKKTTHSEDQLALFKASDSQSPLRRKGPRLSSRIKTIPSHRVSSEEPSLSPESSENLSPKANLYFPLEDSAIRSRELPAIKNVINKEKPNTHSSNDSIRRVHGQPSLRVPSQEHSPRIEIKLAEKEITQDNLGCSRICMQTFNGCFLEKTPSPTQQKDIEYVASTLIETDMDRALSLSSPSNLNEIKHHPHILDAMNEPEFSTLTGHDKDDNACIMSPSSRYEELTSLVMREKKDGMSKSSPKTGEFPHSLAQSENASHHASSKEVPIIEILPEGNCSDSSLQSPWAAEVQDLPFALRHENQPDHHLITNSFGNQVEPALNFSAEHGIAMKEPLIEPQKIQNGSKYSNFENRIQVSNIKGIQTPPISHQTDAQVLYESAMINPWKGDIGNSSTAHLTKQVFVNDLNSDKNLPVDQSFGSRNSSINLRQKSPTDLKGNDSDITTTSCRQDDPMQKKLPNSFSNIKHSQAGGIADISAMAEAFIAADCKIGRDNCQVAQGQTGYTDLQSLAHYEALGMSEIPEFDLDAMLGDVGEILEDWSVEAELNKIKRAERSVP